MAAQAGVDIDQTEIRKLYDDWAEAVRTKNSFKLVANFSPDVQVFDLITPLRYQGLEALRKRADEWLSSFEGPVSYENTDLDITVGGDVAFCHSLNHVHGTNRQGKSINMWWRATVCLKKEGAKWLVIHEHSSVPFDMNTGKASLDSKPS